MASTIDFRVLELTCSRLCHDLISPITAVNNGMELLADSPADIIDEIKSLLSNSAGEASRRLQFYRIAFGLGGRDSAPIGLEESGRLAQGLVDGGKIELDWPSGPGLPDIGKPGTKVLLNALMIAIDALPRGGKVKIGVENGVELSFHLDAEGKGARIHEECANALFTDIAVRDLTPRSVQAYLTKQLVGSAQGTLSVDETGEDSVSVAVKLPPPKN